MLAQTHARQLSQVGHAIRTDTHTHVHTYAHTHIHTCTGLIWRACIPDLLLAGAKWARATSAVRTRMATCLPACLPACLRHTGGCPKISLLSLSLCVCGRQSTGKVSQTADDHIYPHTYPRISLCVCRRSQVQRRHEGGCAQVSMYMCGPCAHNIHLRVSCVCVRRHLHGHVREHRCALRECIQQSIHPSTLPSMCDSLPGGQTSTATLSRASTQTARHRAHTRASNTPGARQ